MNLSLNALCHMDLSINFLFSMYYMKKRAWDKNHFGFLLHAQKLINGGNRSNTTRCSDLNNF
ncbi:hypothetical protein D7L35_05165 [Enterococcus faecalis]|nr:hypothetical protein [Enterococcus faecalis]